MFDEINTLFMATPLLSGGLSLSSVQIGGVLASLGVIQLIFQFFIYPYIEHRICLLTSFKLACIGMAIIGISLPFLRDYALTLGDNVLSSSSLVSVLCILLCMLIVRMISYVLGYISILVLLNNSALHPSHLALVHGKQASVTL